VYGALTEDTAVIGGHTVTILQKKPGITHILFSAPQAADAWLVLTNWVSGFPGREEQAKTVAPVWGLTLESVRFE